MVKNSDLSYGDIVTQAMKMTDRQEVGETLEGVAEQFGKIFCEAIEGNRKNGITGDYYIWIRVQKDMYAANALHLYPMCRRTRPSPYQTEDHYLWKYESDISRLTFQWCIPRKEITAQILANPTKYDETYIRILRSYVKGTLDSRYINEENAEVYKQREEMKRKSEVGKLIF